MPEPINFLRGAIPSPRYELLAAFPHMARSGAPDQFAVVPGKLDPWGNFKFGDCVSAEEAFAKACYFPEIFIPEQTVIDWAKRHGVLNGATLVEVLKAMQADGFKIGEQVYNDGPYHGVNYSDETVLKSAISTGPVKLAIDANALPKGAGNVQGWFATGRGHFPNTDHCVSLSGYGSAQWLYSQLGVPVPSGLDAAKQGYLLFTWSTIGFVDYDWIMSTTVEAWVRNPTTIGVPPLPGPNPPPSPPGPTPPPGPVPPVPPGPVPPVPPGPAKPWTIALSGTITPPVGITVGAVNYLEYIQFALDVFALYNMVKAGALTRSQAAEWVAMAAAAVAAGLPLPPLPVPAPPVPVP